jgi:hypothetical protein
LWDVDAPTFSRQSAHRWRAVCWPYAPAALYPQEDSLVLISVRGRVDARVIVRLKGLGQLKNPMTLSGIEPATFRLVAQCLNFLEFLISVDTSDNTRKVGVTLRLTSEYFGETEFVPEDSPLQCLASSPRPFCSFSDADAAFPAECTQWSSESSTDRYIPESLTS